MRRVAWGWRRRRGADRDGAERALVAESELAGARLELAERERALARLGDDLARARSGQEAAITEAVLAGRTRLVESVATPMAQLVTQARLTEDGRTLQAGEVLRPAMRLVRAMEDEGLTLVGQVGDRAPFDPAAHRPLDARTSLSPGEPAVVRLVGIALEGAIVRKAGVEPEAGG